MYLSIFVNLCKWKDEVDAVQFIDIPFHFAYLKVIIGVIKLG